MVELLEKVLIKQGIKDNKGIMRGNYVDNGRMRKAGDTKREKMGIK